MYNVNIRKLSPRYSISRVAKSDYITNSSGSKSGLIAVSAHFIKFLIDLSPLNVEIGSLASLSFVKMNTVGYPPTPNSEQISRLFGPFNFKTAKSSLKLSDLGDL